jgi:hypothetical protein
MSSIKRQIETGTTTIDTARKVTTIIIVIALGSLILGISLGGLFF